MGEAVGRTGYGAGRQILYLTFGLAQGDVAGRRLTRLRAVL